MQDDKQTYLGDALYASFDGYQIWLAANHPDNRIRLLDGAAHEVQAAVLGGQPAAADEHLLHGVSIARGAPAHA